MADKKDDRGPYTVMARRVEGGPEERIGTHDDIGAAHAQANDAVDTGLYAEANVYDRESRNVHAAVKGEDKRTAGEDHDPTFAA